jgi:hypothetical protein
MSRASTKLHLKREAKPNLKCPKVVNKDMAKLVKLAWNSGAHCESSGKNYVKVWPVDGSKMIRIPSTPSHPTQAYRNKLRALQRAGIGKN